MNGSIYRDIILDHYRDPRNKGHLDHPDKIGDVTNTTCGDKLTLELKLDDAGKVASVAFNGQGCAVSQASASLVTEEMKGKSLDDIQKLNHDDVFRLLGGPVSAGRVNCALLVLKAVEKLH